MIMAEENNNSNNNDNSDHNDTVCVDSCIPTIYLELFIYIFCPMYQQLCLIIEQIGLY